MRNLNSFLVIILLLSLVSCGLFGGGGDSPTPKLKVDIPQDPLVINTSEDIVIINEGEADSKLKWNIRSDQDWLAAKPASGEIVGKGRTDVTLSLSSPFPNNGEQTQVTVSGNGGSSPFQVEASLNCVAPTNQSPNQTQKPPRQPGDTAVPNQLIVRYKKPEGLTTLQSLVTAMESTYNYQTLTSGKDEGPDLIEVAGDFESTVAQLNSDPNIAYAEPNKHLNHLVVTPNDPLFKHQWNMQDFGLPQAWEIETGDVQKGSAPIVIAILDSAVQTDHEDLRDKMLPGCDFHDNDNDPSSPNTNNFHGTHVAGIAAAVGNNNLGVAGVAFGKEIEILPVKIFDDSGVNGNFFDLANAIRWSAGLSVAGFATNPNPAKILNMSLGAAGTSLALNEAIADATNAGALVFAASGNAGLSSAILTPANAPDAIAIGSVDSDFERSSFSNFDETGGKSVDFVGPGGFLKTDTVANCVGANSSAVFSTFPVDNYNCLAGTSMSTPFVSGVAALVWNQNPNFSAAQVRARLEQTTFFDNSWGNGKSFQHGFGVICADRALGGATLCGK